MLEGASIQAVCHSQIRRKLVEALDVSFTATRGHVGCWMSAGEHAYCFRQAKSGIREEEELILSTPCRREQEGAKTSARAVAGEPDVRFSSQGSWTSTR